MMKKIILIAGWFMAVTLIDYSLWTHEPVMLKASTDKAGGQQHLLAASFPPGDENELVASDHFPYTPSGLGEIPLILLAIGLIGLGGIDRFNAPDPLNTRRLRPDRKKWDR